MKYSWTKNITRSKNSQRNDLTHLLRLIIELCAIHKPQQIPCTIFSSGCFPQYTWRNIIKKSRATKPFPIVYNYVKCILYAWYIIIYTKLFQSSFFFALVTISTSVFLEISLTRAHSTCAVHRGKWWNTSNASHTYIMPACLYLCVLIHTCSVQKKMWILNSRVLYTWFYCYVGKHMFLTCWQYQEFWISSLFLKVGQVLVLGFFTFEKDGPKKHCQILRFKWNKVLQRI